MNDFWVGVLMVLTALVLVAGGIMLAQPACSIYEGGVMQIESARVEWTSYDCDKKTGLVRMCGVHIGLPNQPGRGKRSWYTPIACETMEIKLAWGLGE